MTPDNPGNFGVGFVSLEQDVNVLDGGNGGFTTMNEGFEERFLSVGKGDDEFVLSEVTPNL